MTAVKEILGWRAWYTGNRCFDSTGTTWQSLPETGLVVVIAYRETGRTIYNGGDWYWLADGHFAYTPSGEWGTWKPMPSTKVVPCRSCIKQGVGVSDEEFRVVLARALLAEAP